jgi:hypothetical protein
VVLVTTLLLMLAVFAQMRQLRHEQRVQECYARVTGHAVLLGDSWVTDHPQADILARNVLSSCRDDDYRRQINSEHWVRDRGTRNAGD